MTFDTTWDINKYKYKYEMLNHWKLKEKFMLAHKEKFPEDELICLAQTFYNMEVMGCTYDPKLTARIKELSVGLTDKSLRGNEVAYIDASNAISDKYRARTNLPGDKRKKTLDVSKGKQQNYISFVKAGSTFLEGGTYEEAKGNREVEKSQDVIVIEDDNSGETKNSGSSFYDNNRHKDWKFKGAEGRGEKRQFEESSMYERQPKRNPQQIFYDNQSTGGRQQQDKYDSRYKFQQPGHSQYKDYTEQEPNRNQDGRPRGVGTAGGQITSLPGDTGSTWRSYSGNRNPRGLNDREGSNWGGREVGSGLSRDPRRTGLSYEKGRAGAGYSGYSTGGGGYYGGESGGTRGYSEGQGHPSNSGFSGQRRFPDQRGQTGYDYPRKTENQNNYQGQSWGPRGSNQSMSNRLSYSTAKQVMESGPFGKVVLFESNDRNDVPASIIQRTASACHFTTDFSYSNLNNKIYCRMLFNGIFIASGDGQSQKAAKECACRTAIERLKETSFTVKVKASFVGGTTVNRSMEQNEEEKPKGLDKPLEEDNIGRKMMRLMGWSGGGLGRNEQGIEEPIRPTDRSVTRSGLGIQDSKDFRQKALRILEEFARSNTKEDLVFSPDFTKDERKEIHELVRKFNLKSKSYGKEAEARHIVVFKKVTPWEIVEELIECGGETDKYILIPPTSIST